MTTSLTRSSISAIPNDGKPTRDQYVFFARRLKNEMHNEVLRRFAEAKKNERLTQAELARRLDKDPAQVNRWLGAPKNIETDTISELLLAMGYLPKISSVRLADLAPPSNHFETDDILEYDVTKPPPSMGGSKRSSGTLSFDEPAVIKR